jgi:aerobic carbon-monoxide dehydrogenase medium subunit
LFPASFEYVRAGSVEDAIGALAEHGDDARILAGGQSLIPAMRFRLARPTVLVDINGIAQLAGIGEANGDLRIGATCRDVAVERSALVGSRYSLIADAGSVVADPVVRHMGTVVGSLCHNDPSGDWPTVALASRATVIARGTGGERRIAIDDFIIDSFTTALADGEVAVAVLFPTPSERTAGAYMKIERKVGDFATAAAAVQLTLEADGTIGDAGVALASAGPTAIRVPGAEAALVGQHPSADVIRAAGHAARQAADPGADLRGSVAYKKDMAGVLVERGIRTSLRRLGVEVPA